MNDADIEQAELEAAGNRSAARRRRGICDHGYYQAQPGFMKGPATCLDCGAVFASEEDLMEARQFILDNK